MVNFKSIFGCCGPFPQDFGQVLARIILCFVKIVRECFIDACPMSFYFALRSMSAGRSTQTYEECSNLSIYCGKQYVGETTGEFRFRWNSYRCNDRKYTKNEDYFQEHLFRYFHSGEHTGFLENVKITLIDKTDGQNPQKREDYWRRTLKTYTPFGLNVEDSV